MVRRIRLSLLYKIALMAMMLANIPLLVMIGVIIAYHPRHIVLGAFVYLAMTVLTFWAAVLFARHITNPIRTFMKAIDRTSHGDFSVPTQVSTRDEFYDLSVVFNKMLEDMSKFSSMRVDEQMAEKAKTEAIIYSSEDGILLTDHRGLVQLINPKARDMMELGEASLDELAGRPLWSHLKNDKMAVAVREGIESPAPRVVLELNLSAEGLRRYYSLSVTHVDPPHSAEASEWSVLILRNISAEKELSALKDEFLQSLTHDLRSPMTAIRGYLQVLGEEMAGPITEQQKKMIQIMENASTKLLHIISNLLDSAKMSAGKLKLSLAEVNMRQLAPTTLEILHSEAAKKKITLTLDMPEQVPMIKLDPSLIERVIINLVNNSIKFTPDGGFVTVKFLNFSDRLQCQVIDTGPGIPAEFMSRMFKKFEQVGGTRGGTGLGLSNCKYIVEAHYGEIRVNSQVGQGTTFTFVIPRGLEQNEKGDIFRVQPLPLASNQ